jgi:four helix bundle protein
MRRASVSVLANIVEDCAKESSAEFARFLTISIGSITELEVSIELSLDLNFIKQQQFDKMYGLLIETKKLLYVSRRTVRYRRS